MPDPPPGHRWRQDRPDRQEMVRVTLSENKWYKLYDLKGFDVDSWVFTNESAVQSVHLGYRENEDNYQIVMAQQIVNSESSPSEIWVRRSTSTSSPSVHLKILCFSSKKRW